MPINREKACCRLEAYAREREPSARASSTHKKRRTVHLGEHVTLLFEDELTIRYQVQEMLRIERIFEEDGIQRRARRLQPAGSRRLQLEGDDADRVPRRGRAQARARAAEGHRAARVGRRSQGRERVHAIADEDLERETEEKTSSVHFLRFELDAAMRERARARRGVRIGVEHPHYRASSELAPEVRAALCADLR